MAAYSGSSLMEAKLHGGEINGGYALKTLDMVYAAKNSYECGYLSLGENKKNAPDPSFIQNESSRDEADEQIEEGFLTIFIHHALGIHNICIYDNQDVYAKFCLSHDPEKAVRTRIVQKGGKTPVFNESLQLGGCHVDSVLKCEIWMSSQALTYLEDQLLGFVLVPLCSLVGKGEHSQDYALSSTELFHSHAGTIRLTFMYHQQKRSSPTVPLYKESIPPGDLLVDDMNPEGKNNGGGNGSGGRGQIEPLFSSEYADVEFTDMEAIVEDQQLVSNYLGVASNREDCRGLAAAAENGIITGPPYLRIRSAAAAGERNGEEHSGDGSSMADDCQILDFAALKAANSSEAQPSGGSQMEATNSPPSTNYLPASLQAAPCTSSCQDLHSGNSVPNSSVQIESEKERALPEDALGGIATLPLLNLTLETEEPTVVQQQIVDMYVESMNQFTEALAMVQLRMDMDIQEAPPANNASSEHDSGESGKKNSHKVFYGSRAFF